MVFRYTSICVFIEKSMTIVYISDRQVVWIAHTSESLCAYTHSEYKFMLFWYMEESGCEHAYTLFIYKDSIHLLN